MYDNVPNQVLDGRIETEDIISLQPSMVVKVLRQGFVYGKSGGGVATYILLLASRVGCHFPPAVCGIDRRDLRRSRPIPNTLTTAIEERLSTLVLGDCLFISGLWQW